MQLIASPEQVAQTVQGLYYNDNTVDLSAIKAAIKEVEDARVYTLLRATSDLAQTTLPKGRRFIVVYYCDGEVKTARGIAYREEKYSPEERKDSEKIAGYGVLLDDYRARFNSRYMSMENFKEDLEEDYGKLYRIAYLD